MVRVPFASRLEAGRLLAAELAHRGIGANGAGIVLALARGGVPVGFAVAERMRLPLDIVSARKIGVPWQPELAMGAIAGSVRVLDDRLIRELEIADDDVEEIVAREQAEMQRREALYRGGNPALDPRGKSVILVDDGLATGNTMLASARHVRSREPARLTIAVPVGSKEACASLQKEADELVCLSIPERFYAVGEWYREFPQVGDAEVRKLLAESRMLTRHAA